MYKEIADAASRQGSRSRGWCRPARRGMCQETGRRRFLYMLVGAVKVEGSPTRLSRLSPHGGATGTATRADRVPWAGPGPRTGSGPLPGAAGRGEPCTRKTTIPYECCSCGDEPPAVPAGRRRDGGAHAASHAHRRVQGKCAAPGIVRLPSASRACALRLARPEAPRRSARRRLPRTRGRTTGRPRVSALRVGERESLPRNRDRRPPDQSRGQRTQRDDGAADVDRGRRPVHERRRTLVAADVREH
jgi:hypothetical protein